MVNRIEFGTWDPWRELRQLQREMNRLLGSRSAVAPTSTAAPAVDVWQTENGAVLTAELPGLDQEKLDISVFGDTLTLKGERTADEFQNDTKFHRRERPTGSFIRHVKLPFRVDAQKTEAKYERGVLTITLPQVEEDKPRKISIKSL